MSVSPTIIRLENVSKSYQVAGMEFQALKNVSLTIEQGEIVAIVGASGSGKSTLMNIIGCMDQPTQGKYYFRTSLVSQLDSNAQASLRRKAFGFIFQRYHLISFFNSIENIELPALYERVPMQQRRRHATALLQKFGLATKDDAKPSQLSGGQQQRVSICRALINDPDIILADEPTGALDKQSGQEVLATLQQLNKAGKTVIIITHDMQVARAADRIICLDEGQIAADSGPKSSPTGSPHLTQQRPHDRTGGISLSSLLSCVFRVVQAKPLRTFLTMLGIIIGITSVVLIQAIGSGAKNSALHDIRVLANKSIFVYPGGNDIVASWSGIRNLDDSDLAVIRQLSVVDSATPISGKNITVHAAAKSSKGMLYGVGSEFLNVRSYQIIAGQGIRQSDLDNHRPYVVIDENTRNTFFPAGDAIGKLLVLDGHPATVVGVARTVKGLLSGEDRNLRIWTNYNAAHTRWFGLSSFAQIDIRIKNTVPMLQAQSEISAALLQLHGKQDFTVFNADAVARTAETVGETLNIMLLSTAVVTLLVGGLGVMNIMLVSVVERTQEIGIRMAIGARRRDILHQFLLESLTLCLFGGLIGLFFAWMLCVLVAQLNLRIVPVFSWQVMVVAFVFSSLIGIIFGFFPARQAARLNPIDALSRE